MGDLRYARYYDRIRDAMDPTAEIRLQSDEGVISALAAASQERDPYIANVLATEALNRMQRSMTIARNLADGVFALDGEGRFTFINSAAERILAWGPAELLGLGAHETIHYQREDGSSYPREACPLLAVMETREPQHTDDEAFTRKDGTPIPVSATSAPVILDGEVMGAVFVFRDVTGRRRSEEERERLLAREKDARAQAERALRERDETLALLDTLFAKAPVGLAFVDNELRYVRVNETLAAINGVPPEAHVGRLLRDVVPDLADRLEPIYRRVIERGASVSDLPVSGETQALPGEKRHWLASYYPVRSGDGGRLGVGVVVKEITERRRAEEALRVSEERFRAIIEESPLSIQVFSPDGRTLQANRAWEQLWGAPREVLAHYNILNDPQLVERGVMPHILKGFAGEATKIPSVFYDPTELGFNGRARWLGAFIYPIKDEEGRVKEVVLIHEDTTESKETEEGIRKLNAALEKRVRERTAELVAANQELEAFSCSVSHDLRAPLRGIDFFSRLLEEEYGDKLDPEGRDHLRRVRDESHHLTELVTDLLELSRVSREEIECENVDLSALARSVIEGLRRAHPGRDVEVQVAEGAVVDGDAGLLRSVLENLLGNAWKFTSKTPSARIELGVSNQDGRPVYYVRDNGVGFDMANAERLFVTFQRLHRKQEFEGTGIGLATVKRIIQRHGGKVWAEGRVGHGATFFFTLPERGPSEAHLERLRSRLGIPPSVPSTDNPAA